MPLIFVPYGCTKSNQDLVEPAVFCQLDDLLDPSLHLADIWILAVVVIWMQDLHFHISGKAENKIFFRKEESFSTNF